jgi:hypothetical protein
MQQSAEDDFLGAAPAGPRASPRSAWSSPLSPGGGAKTRQVAAAPNRPHLRILLSDTSDDLGDGISCGQDEEHSVLEVQHERSDAARGALVKAQTQDRAERFGTALTPFDLAVIGARNRGWLQTWHVEYLWGRHADSPLRPWLVHELSPFTVSWRRFYNLCALVAAFMIPVSIAFRNAAGATFGAASTYSTYFFESFSG